jgi:hypothetical protein
MKEGAFRNVVAKGNGSWVRETAFVVGMQDAFPPTSSRWAMEIVTIMARRVSVTVLNGERGGGYGAIEEEITYAASAAIGVYRHQSRSFGARVSDKLTK